MLGDESEVVYNRATTKIQESSEMNSNSKKGTGSVTGVDISKQRISTCKSLVRKYKLRRVRLFVDDGTKFNTLAPSRIGAWERALNSDQDQSMYNDTVDSKFLKPFLVTQLLSSDPQLRHSSLLYDKVLVDAECTHDGSMAHIVKCCKDKDGNGWKQFEERYNSPQYLDSLEHLQRNLIQNGIYIYANLKNTIDPFFHILGFRL